MTGVLAGKVVSVEAWMCAAGVLLAPQAFAPFISAGLWSLGTRGASEVGARQYHPSPVSLEQALLLVAVETYFNLLYKIQL